MPLAFIVPGALDLDTFDGRTWIGVVPFRMTGIRPRWLPPVPWLSAFAELNVRTYVTVGGKPGGNEPLAITCAEAAGLAGRSDRIRSRVATASSCRNGSTPLAFSASTTAWD